MVANSNDAMTINQDADTPAILPCRERTVLGADGIAACPLIASITQSLAGCGPAAPAAVRLGEFQRAAMRRRARR
jgi:hypothetical protein